MKSVAKSVNKGCPSEVHQFLNTWRANVQREEFKKFEQNWQIDETQDFFAFVPSKEPHSLFLGTFPVPETVTAGFFYHSDSNAFWTILQAISGFELLTLQRKFEFLIKLNLGITDIIREARRTDEKCISRIDSKLSVIRLNNLMNLLKQYPSIKTIYLTSGGPKSKSLKGSNAGGWLAQQLGINTSPFIVINRGGAKLDIKSAKKLIDVRLIFLYTPAPQDKQIASHLKSKKIQDAFRSLKYFDKLKSFENHLEQDALKLKYKCVQWATYLSEIEGMVTSDLINELREKSLHTLLMENS